MRKALCALFFLVMGQSYAEITTPAVVETRLGKLEFPLGVPIPQTVATLYDHLDYIHGINSFLNAFPGVSMWAFRQGLLRAGVHDNEALIFSKRIDSKSLFLTANADAISFFSFVDLSQGPMVIEMTSYAHVVVNDMWQRWVTDMETRGKYLFVPPGYKGPLPESGYFIAHARTSRVICFGYTFSDAIKKNFRIYSYSSKGDHETRFIEGAGLSINTIPPNDYSFYELLDALVQDQPVEAVDPEIAGNLAAVGIVKGKKFQPDERMKQTLSASATHGNAVSRVIVFRPRLAEDFNFYGADSRWMYYAFDTLDSRTAYFYIATGIPHSQKAYRLTAFLDSQAQPLDGSKTYRLKLPGNIPDSEYWSVTLYDNQTRSMLQTPQGYPRAGSPSTADPEGFITLYFAPQKPQSVHEKNWIQTMPGQGFFVQLRLRGPLQPFFDKTWKPGEIEQVNQ